MTEPVQPILTGKSGVVVEERITKAIIAGCPKCETELDVTNVKFGAHIECPSCENVTYSPGRKPSWWAFPKKVKYRIVFSFFIGVAASFVGSMLWHASGIEEEKNDQQGKTEQVYNNDSTNQLNNIKDGN